MVDLSQYTKRRKLLTLGALPAHQVPKCSRDATGFFLYVHKVRSTGR